MNDLLSAYPGRVVRLEDVVVCHQQISRNPANDGLTRFLKVEHMDRGHLRLSRWGLLTEEEIPPTFYNVFRKGHVLFPSRNPHLRRVVWPDFDGICGEKTFVLQARDGLLQELLPFIMQDEALVEHAVKMKVGSTNPHVRWRDLASFEFTLPQLEEQKRIAAALQAIEKARDSLVDLIVGTSALRKSLLRESLTHRKGWEQTTLSEVAQVVGGGTPSTSNDKYWNGDIPWLTPTEVVAANGGTICESERKITKEGLASSSAKLLPAGAVLLTTRATIGAAAIAGRDLTTNQGFQSLIPGERTSSRFLLLWCQNNLSQLLSRASGSTFLEVSSKEVKKLKISLPPQAVQAEIVEHIDQLDSAIVDSKKRVPRLDRLKTAVLRGHSGELTS